MATSRPKQKDPVEILLDSVDELVDSAAARMNTEELHKVRKEINDLVDDAVAARKRRRETA